MACREPDVRDQRPSGLPAAWAQQEGSEQAQCRGCAMTQQLLQDHHQRRRPLRLRHQSWPQRSVMPQLCDGTD
eukprot:scaffold21748_cov129-Isochrysis_galbana.AAC.4